MSPKPPTPSRPSEGPRGRQPAGRDAAPPPAGVDPPPDGLRLDEIVARLPTGPGGVEFVYGLLDHVVAVTGVADAVLVAELPRLGIQVFRAGRRPIDRTVAPGALAAVPGLHVTPERVPAGTRELLARLCTTALALDVALHDSAHDGLTGLANRRSFDEALARAVSRTGRYGQPFSLVLLDIDDFKVLNDEQGHAAGDEVLRLVADELRRGLRSGDVAARVGGDEFGLILPGDPARARTAVAGRLAASVERRLGWAIRLSAGFAAAPEDALDATGLYRTADARLYRDKPG